MWIPQEIRMYRKGKGLEAPSMNVTTNFSMSMTPLGSDVYKRIQNTAENEHTFTENVKEIDDSPMKLSKRQKIDPEALKLDWEFFDAINTIMEYTNVVLNDLEIFQTPEIYTSFIRCYQNHLPERVIDCMLNTTYKITIDKNHRISNNRYNAMFSKDMIKSFSHVLHLF